MLLKEDGQLDIERVRQLSEEELEKEMEDWGEDQWFDWFGRDGVMSVEDFFELVDQKIEEFYADKHKQINTEYDGAN